MSPAATDFVSVTTSNSSRPGQETLIAFGLDGNVVAATFVDFSQPGQVVQLQTPTPSIHQLRLVTDNFIDDFCFSPAAQTGGDGQIAVHAGDNQRARPGEGVPIPPAVRATDGSGNPLQGVRVTFDVTSGDGLDDGQERRSLTDPRQPDSDFDSLSDRDEIKIYTSNPTSVDSDEDSRGPNRDRVPNPRLFDGNEILTLGTSPTLDDTDGDARTDYEEIILNSTNPLVADVPRAAIVVEGDVDLRSSTRFSQGDVWLPTHSREMPMMRLASRFITGSLYNGGAME